VLRGVSPRFTKSALQVLSLYRNQGGFDMLGRTVDQVRTEEQLEATCDVCSALDLDGLVMVGGKFGFA
jgi:diphosphate-dependent phosphofructokinase